MLEPDLRFKVCWGGREWQTRSGIDAGLLVEMLKQSFPDRAEPEVWEQAAMGFFDEASGLNVDGFGWRRGDWDGTGIVERDELDSEHQ